MFFAFDEANIIVLKISWGKLNSLLGTNEMIILTFIGISCNMSTSSLISSSNFCDSIVHNSNSDTMMKAEPPKQTVNMIIEGVSRL